MKETLKVAGVVLFVGMVLAVSISYSIWRVRQFQKATGFGFVKAALVLGK